MNPENLKWMINAIPDAAILVNQEQQIVAANLKAADLFDRTTESLEDAPLDILIPESSVKSHHDHVRRYFSQPQQRPMGTGLRFHGQREDSSTFPVDIMLSQFRVESLDYTLAVIRDDSERAEVQAMQEKLQSANARLARAQEVGGLAWWETNLETGQLIWSTTVPQLLGLQPDEKPSFPAAQSMCVPEDRLQFDAFHGHWGAISARTVCYRIRKKEGEIRWIEETVHQEADHIVIGVMRDITDQKNLEEKLRTESVTDELTGLFNRKQFNQDLNSRYSSFIRSGIISSIVMYDFDHFKNINDVYGHAMGDEVLKQAASLVVDQLRPSDNAYRLGGEEFAILLNGTDTDDAKTFAERIRKSVEAARFKIDDVRTCATISLGIAKFRSDDRCFEDALKRADGALYRSKANARNNVSTCD
ncbi:hypothetical protein CLH62_17170 [Marinobacter guineae]|uniref:diguanylate cyclase n=1 Tax=Marinobacter guineae TaxID=432303 RepID=A0A2G1VD77_9GAMM|nr:sensor domain-containing diguanylate cyclase [Marinobacter guineae]PHQ24620.1 hypothetical protein CLH62_17170 [Marinobacter guineae]